MKSTPEILAAFHALDERRRREALAIAAREALAVWRAYAKPWQPVTYVDSIVGMRHEVDLDLPHRAMEEIEAAIAGNTIVAAVTEREYQEPIVAMQDGDLELPDAIELAYYAIYNLHRIVFQLGAGLPSEQVVIDQVAGATGLDADDWLADWWTRVWDRWATSAEDP